jgi:hypothetical protein
MNYSGPVVCVLRQERSSSLLMCAVHAHELVKSRKMFRLSTGNMKMIQQENFIQLVIAPMNAEASFWHFWNWNTYTTVLNRQKNSCKMLVIICYISNI